jgi:hypothetical protein
VECSASSRLWTFAARIDLFALGGGLGENLLNERSYDVIDCRPNSIFERHCHVSTRTGSWGTQAAAGMRAIVRIVVIMGRPRRSSQGSIAVKRLRTNHLDRPTSTAQRVSNMLILRMRRLAGIVIFNAVLAAAMQALAPDQPRMTDRNDYEYTGRQPLAANCPNTIYCYRILVPMLLERVPMDPERRWRGLQWLAHTATGSVVAVAQRHRFTPYRLDIAADLVRLCIYGIRPLHGRSGCLLHLRPDSVFVARRSCLGGHTSRSVRGLRQGNGGARRIGSSARGAALE